MQHTCSFREAVTDQQKIAHAHWQPCFAPQLPEPVQLHISAERLCRGAPEECMLDMLCCVHARQRAPAKAMPPSGSQALHQLLLRLLALVCHQSHQRLQQVLTCLAGAPSCAAG